MTELILLVVAAAWLAVLIPPMLRSRVENRPNSSVTDFRRQLTKLQNTATPPRGAVRAMGRPLHQSPLSRPVAGGRPPQPTLRSGVTRHPSQAEREALRRSTALAPVPDHHTVDVARFRSHGDPTDGQRRPAGRTATRQRTAPVERGPRNDRAVRHDTVHRDDASRRSHGEVTGGQRRPADATGEVKRRRSNILFMLVLTTACTLFLAATTSSDVMLYAFIGAFLALCAYVYLLAQGNQREPIAAREGWSDRY